MYSSPLEEMSVMKYFNITKIPIVMINNDNKGNVILVIVINSNNN